MWNGKDSFYCELMCVPAWMGSVSAEIIVLLLRRASLAHERGPALVLNPLRPLVVDGMRAEALNHFMSPRLPFGSPPRL